MLGFNPLSSAPISSLGGFPPITGYINTTDNNDTATLNAFELDTGVIYTTDSNDTSNIAGTVSNTTITGSINTTDNNDTANIQGQESTTMDMHDGFTRKEVERAKELQRKRRAAEEKLIALRRADAEKRKQNFKDLIDPQPKVSKRKQNKVELNQEIRIDTPSVEISRLESVIANLDRQEQELNKAIAHRRVLAETMAALAIFDAKLKAEKDDEEALLLLL